jgi:hypothetical protein
MRLKWEAVLGFERAKDARIYRHKIIKSGVTKSASKESSIVRYAEPTSGTPSPRQIFRASEFGISV